MIFPSYSGAISVILIPLPPTLRARIKHRATFVRTPDLLRMIQRLRISAFLARRVNQSVDFDISLGYLLDVGS